jgi:hypothetical protein
MAWGDAPDGIKIVSNNIIDKGRWSIHHEIVVQQISTGKFFRDTYSIGATETQDERPWQHEDPDFTEVFPVEKTIIVYT